MFVLLSLVFICATILVRKYLHCLRFYELYVL